MNQHYSQQNWWDDWGTELWHCWTNSRNLRSLRITVILCSFAGYCIVWWLKWLVKLGRTAGHTGHTAQEESLEICHYTSDHVKLLCSLERNMFVCTFPFLELIICHSFLMIFTMKFLYNEKFLKKTFYHQISDLWYQKARLSRTTQDSEWTAVIRSGRVHDNITGKQNLKVGSVADTLHTQLYQCSSGPDYATL